MSALQSGSLTENQGAQLGIQGNPAIYNLDRGAIASDLKKSANPYATDQGGNYAATTPDWQNFGGLQALIGGMNNNASQVSALGQVGLTGTQDQVGKVNPSYQFDNGALQSQIAGQQAAYDQGWNSPSANGGPTYAAMQNYIQQHGNNLLPGQTLQNNFQNAPGGFDSGDQTAQNYQQAIAAYNQAHGVTNQLFNPNGPSMRDESLIGRPDLGAQL